MLLTSIDFGKIASNAVTKHSAKVLAGAALTGVDARNIPSLTNYVVDGIMDAYTSEDDFEECFLDLADEIGSAAAVAVFSEFVSDETVSGWEAKTTAS